MNQFREKYKSDQRLQKEKEKREKTIEKARIRQQEKIRLAIEKSKNNIITRNEKQLARFEKKQWTQAEKKAREILGLKQTKKTTKKTSDSVTYWKDKALTEFQKRARLARSRSVYPSSDPVVITRDTMQEKPRNKKVNGWHIFSKHNYPHIAFELNNCRPITSQGNRMQGDQIGSRRPNAIDQEDFDKLKALADDKELKRQFQSMNNEQKKEYYKSKYEEYKQKNDELQK